MKQYLEQREKEFRQGYGHRYVSISGINYFQLQTIIGLLEKIKEKLEKEMEEEWLLVIGFYSKNKLVIGFYSKNKEAKIAETGYKRIVEHSKMMARNQMRKDQISYLDDLIKELKK